MSWPCAIASRRILRRRAWSKVTLALALAVRNASLPSCVFTMTIPTVRPHRAHQRLPSPFRPRTTTAVRASTSRPCATIRTTTHPCKHLWNRTIRVRIQIGTLCPYTPAEPPLGLTPRIQELTPNSPVQPSRGPIYANDIMLPPYSMSSSASIDSPPACKTPYRYWIYLCCSSTPFLCWQGRVKRRIHQPNAPVAHWPAAFQPHTIKIMSLMMHLWATIPI